MKSSKEDHVIDPGQSWEVDLFRPEDAEGVARLFVSVYGEGYPIRTYVEPESLIEENAAGRTISSVARTPKGDIVGHNALYHSAPHPGIRESGAGVVHAHYRGGKGIFTRLVAHGQEVGAKKFGIEAIYGESVCNHIFSQRLCYGLGCRTRAVEVDLMPASAYEQEKSAAGRVASLLDFKTLIPKPQVVFLPAVYEEALRFIYDDMDDERQINRSEEALPAQKRTEILRQIFDFARVARLAVQEAGADFSSVFDREEKTVLDQGMVVIQVWFRLTWPWAGQVADLLRDRGYFLGGVLPRWFEDDGLLMQKILKKPDWEGIQIHFDRAKKVLEYVQDDWVQVSNPGR